MKLIQNFLGFFCRYALGIKRRRFSASADFLVDCSTSPGAMAIFPEFVGVQKTGKAIAIGL
jgi:hypothetical protein